MLYEEKDISNIMAILETIERLKYLKLENEEKDLFEAAEKDIKED